jgi:hypothetical protein
MDGCGYRVRERQRRVPTFGMPERGAVRFRCPLPTRGLLFSPVYRVPSPLRSGRKLAPPPAGVTTGVEGGAKNPEEGTQATQHHKRVAPTLVVAPMPAEVRVWIWKRGGEEPLSM